MEEICQKEKDLKQLVQMTSILFDRSQDLTVKNEAMSNQLSQYELDNSKLNN